MSSSPFEIVTRKPLPFDYLSPDEFEALCFWLVRREGFERAEHLGKSGSDEGLDIVAYRGGRLCGFQCKRVREFGPRAAAAEINKLLRIAPGDRPEEVYFLVTCGVSRSSRKAAREGWGRPEQVHFWASTELDERVQRHEDIVVHFFRGDSRARARPSPGLLEDPIEDLSTLNPRLYAALLEMLRSGEAGAWAEIQAVFRQLTDREEIKPAESLGLVVKYDIARVRKLIHHDGPLVFFDSSWLSHDYGFWSTSPDMRRWLRELGRVAFRRAKGGRRTSRVFYWQPDDIYSLSVLDQAKETILSHLSYGISVYLVEPRFWGKVIDAQLFTTRDALASVDFHDFRIDQLKGRAEVDKVLSHFEELQDLVAAGDAVFFPLETKPQQVMQRLVQRCRKLRGVIE